MLTEDEENLIQGLTWRYETKYTGTNGIPGINTVIEAVQVYHDEHRQLLQIIKKLRQQEEPEPLKLRCKYQSAHGICNGPYLTPYHRPRNTQNYGGHIFHLVEDAYPNGDPEKGGLGYNYDE